MPMTLKEWNEGRKPVTEKTEREQEYANNIFSKKADKTLTFEEIQNRFNQNLKKSSRKIRPYPIDLDAAKRLVFDGIKNELLGMGKIPIWDSFNKKIIPILIAFFTGNRPQGTDVFGESIDPKKGILLCGETEKGKSFLFKIFQKFVYALDYEQRKFKIVNMNEVEFQIKSVQNIKPIGKYLSGVWCFDDLGVEKDLTLYNNKVKITDEIIQIRYESFQNNGILTHGTTNQTPADLKKNYDERTFSRMKEMFNILYLGGEDKRK